jgi:hypothetical protein
MSTQESLPYPDANSIMDILTEEQKQVLKRLEAQQIIAHLENKPSQVPAEIWPKIMKANLPKVVEALQSNNLTSAWANRATLLIQANQQALEP